MMPTTTYLYDDDNLLAEFQDGALATAYTYEPQQYGNLISDQIGANYSQYHYDGVGSTVDVTNEQQQPIDSTRYSAFGQQAAIMPTPFSFCGRVGYYNESPFVHIRRRNYMVADGRWISKDPQEQMSWHRCNGYIYVRNHPLSRRDPSGMADVTDIFPPSCPDGIPPPPSQCGSDVTSEVDRIILSVHRQYADLSDDDKARMCDQMYSAGGWDIPLLAGKMVGAQSSLCKVTDDCAGTVTLYGQCHRSHNVNYILWGAGHRVCGMSLTRAMLVTSLWKLRYYTTSYEAGLFTKWGYNWNPNVPTTPGLIDRFQQWQFGRPDCRPCSSLPPIGLSGQLGGVIQIPKYKIRSKDHT